MTNNFFAFQFQQAVSKRLRTLYVIASFIGDFEKANSILANFDHRYPGYAVVALRRIGIERRFAMKQAGDRLVICDATIKLWFY